MFTFSQIKTKAREIAKVEALPMRYALDEAYHALYAEYEKAERETEAEALAALEAKYERSAFRGYA